MFYLADGRHDWNFPIALDFQEMECRILNADGDTIFRRPFNCVLTRFAVVATPEKKRL
jgi:hypothetical protein